MTPLIPQRIVRLGLLAALATSGSGLSGQTAPAALQSDAGPGPAVPGQNGEYRDAVVKMSPFEVAQSRNGYYAENTTAGTRLNSKIEDLGAAISVVTKQQMQDFALLDINDVFNYEVSTLGTGNYTDYAFTASGMPIDNVMLNPQGANRIRGLAPANTTVGNFESTGRIPVDPLDIEAVEISRGPNASLFGIGSPSGTVNNVPAKASTSRNSSTTSDRVDSFSGYRLSLDVNRVLLPNKLGVRFSAVDQYDGFERKPSGVNSHRYNGEVEYRPFKSTTINGYFHFYEMSGNRPNFTMPRDAITPWQNVGSPTWNPVTQTLYVNGAAAGKYAAGSPPGLGVVSSSASNFYADTTGGGYFSPTETTDNGNPATPNQAVRLMQVNGDPTGYLASQPLFQKTYVMSNKAIYDYTKVNLGAENYDKDIGRVSSVVLDQMIVDTPTQTLAAEAGFYAENTQRYQSNPFGQASPAQGFVDTVSLDVNQTLLNGMPNPYYLRPFVLLDSPETFSQPVKQTDYRAQLAYILDLRHTSGWKHWLGRHQIVGYGEYTDNKNYQFTYVDAILDNHTWLGPNSGGRGLEAAFGGLAASPVITQPLFRYYLGGPPGSGSTIVNHAPKAFTPGTYALQWGNGVTGSFTDEPTQLGLAPYQTTGGLNDVRNIVKSRGAVWQSSLFNDKLMTTVGTRLDRSFSENGATPFFDNPTTLNRASVDRWTGNWAVAQGPTKTLGAVLRPVPWFEIFANKSDSFQPAPIAYGMGHELLPNPSGSGHDVGFGLHLFDGKLVLRVDRFMTEAINSRDGNSTTSAQRSYRLDYANATSMPLNLQRNAAIWAGNAASAQGQTLTSDQLLTAEAAIMKLPVSFLQNEYNAQATDDIKSVGTELELNYSPVDFVTIKFNATQTEAINSGIASEVTDWLSQRLAVWQNIVDPTTGQLWWTSAYSGTRPVDYYTANVSSPLQVAQALAGKSMPQISKYRFNLLGSLRLAGITENPTLRKFTVGGALRWQDKQAVGFYGAELPPAIVTSLDVNKPIWSPAQAYVDAFVTYRTRTFGDKVGTTFQLNVRNLNQSGGLQVIAAQPDGSVNGYRIVDPRSFIFTVTFSL